MHRSLKAIQADLLNAADPGRWDELTNELRLHVQTWQSVRTILGLNRNIWDASDFYSDRPAHLDATTGRIALMKDFLGINILSFSDMLPLSTVMCELLKNAQEVDDTDEGIWSLRDFLRREQGQVVSREICASDYDPDPYFMKSYKNVDFTDGSWDDEISLYEFRGFDPIDDNYFEPPPRGLFRWWIDCEEKFNDIELIRKMLGRKEIETSTLKNLQCTIQPYFSVPCRFYRCGLAGAILAPMRYLSRRSRFHAMAGSSLR